MDDKKESGLRILIVEDDLPLQILCSEALRSEGFSTETCGSVATGVAAFNKNRPHLLLLDINLPDGTGLDVAKKTGVAQNRDVPFMFMTARGDSDTRLTCFRLGASDYIQKPIVIEELIARVRVHLEIQKSREHVSKISYEAEVRERARQDMMDMIVHDLKAPLSSIKGTLELLRLQGLVTDKNCERFNNIGNTANFMLLMLNDLLDIGHAQAVGLSVSPSSIELSALTEKLKSFFSGYCETLGIKLEFQISPMLASIETDQNLIFRVLANLISNATHFSERGQSVLVAAERQKNGQVRLSVLDRGPGVPDAEKEKIFEKFVTKGKTATGMEAESGTGIGLTFCRLAAEAMKGRVWVEDRPGGGSVFHFEFPEKSRAAAGVS